jgi:TRAP-type mannitol/chloroaromatic compound transport system permease small subunit
MSNLRVGFQDVLDTFVEQMGSYLPNLAAALAILIVGWLLALIISKLVQGALKRTSIDNRIAGWVKGEEEPPPDIEPAIGRAVFWLLMIFVLVAFFHALKLTVVTGPFNSFLNQIFEYLPRLLSAGLLLLVAWLVASGVRLLVRTALRSIHLDERVGREVKDTEGEEAETQAEQASLTHMLSETVYWLIFLLFLPAILDALALEGLMTPVRSMVGRVLDFLPNLFAAAIIFLLGWFLARIIQRIISNLLAAAGLDRVSERVGMEKVLGKQRLSGLLGLVVYALILIPVLISALNALQLEAITEPASAMLDRILQALPLLFGAALVLVIAYVIGRVVAGLVSNLLAAAGFDRTLERLGLAWKSESGDGVSVMVGHLLLVVIMLFAAIEAMELLEFSQVAAMLSAFTVFLGNVLLGLVIFGLGLYLANLAARTLRASSTSWAPGLAVAARVAIVVLAGAMALRQMQVAEDIINLAFGLILGAAAVAAAIAFGIGGRELAAQQLEKWMRSVRSVGEGRSTD